jgi:hypothetical protein
MYRIEVRIKQRAIQGVTNDTDEEGLSIALVVFRIDVYELVLDDSSLDEEVKGAEWKHKWVER